DGIRDATVTGVQTCALPILEPPNATRSVVTLTPEGTEERRPVDVNDDAALLKSYFVDLMPLMVSEVPVSPEGGDPNGRDFQNASLDPHMNWPYRSASLAFLKPLPSSLQT